LVAKMGRMDRAAIEDLFEYVSYCWEEISVAKP